MRRVFDGIAGKGMNPQSDLRRTRKIQMRIFLMDDKTGERIPEGTCEVFLKAGFRLRGINDISHYRF
jgi:hypothetical protein